MQAVKIRKIGNSLGVVIPKEVLARMKVGEGETLYFTDALDGSVRLTPVDEEFAAQMEQAERVMRADRHILRELAKR
ncbi:MAG: transcriptional regulator [Desulfovibrionales bacterium GWA2_65_9]|nr:MAG: transcriptional regulator [Desulfovibrionales bacterium GWA2_65_9]